LQKWWQALSQPKTPQTRGSKPGATSKSGTPSQAEITAIAMRHPAWKLADALEENRAQPLQFEAIAVRSSVAGSTPKTPGFDVNLPPTSNALETDGRNLPAPALGEADLGEAENADDFSAPIVIAPDAQALREAARERQENSIEDFLRAVQTRQINWQRDYREVLKTALGEEIEVAEQRVPDSLAVVLPSPELQLEMTNLRLQLLSNVFSTPAERKKASARLEELMALWRAALAKQEKIRADELERLRVEEPEQLKRAGLIRLEEQLELIRRAQQANRAAIAAEHRARTEADFGNENARLAIALPPLPALGVLPAPVTAPFAGEINPRNPLLEKIIFPRTRTPQSASVNNFSGVDASRTQILAARSEQIRALRALAWRDAKRQARMAQRLEN
jgi:hypothetical protein